MEHNNATGYIQSKAQLMSEGQWFSCAPAVREQSLSSLAHPHSRMARFCLAAQILSADSRNVRSHRRQHLGVYAGHAGSLYRVMGGCNVAETIGWTSFISTSGSFDATTGPNGKDHMACKLPLKCRDGESDAVAQHTKRATIQGRAGYVQLAQTTSPCSPVFGCLRLCLRLPATRCGSCVAGTSSMPCLPPIGFYYDSNIQHCEYRVWG
jgi:hypothetical protein